MQDSFLGRERGECRWVQKMHVRVSTPAGVFVGLNKILDIFKEKNCQIRL